jgi:hypothetical protein
MRTDRTREGGLAFGVGRTRGNFLKVAAGGGALLALGAPAGCEPDPRIRATASPARRADLVVPLTP